MRQGPAANRVGAERRPHGVFADGQRLQRRRQGAGAKQVDGPIDIGFGRMTRDLSLRRELPAIILADEISMSVQENGELS